MPVAVGVAVAVAVGVGVAPLAIVMDPLVCVGIQLCRLSSIKKKLLGAAAQTKVLESPGLPVLNGLSSNNVPDPASGTKGYVSGTNILVFVSGQAISNDQGGGDKFVPMPSTTTA